MSNENIYIQAISRDGSILSAVAFKKTYLREGGMHIIAKAFTRLIQEASIKGNVDKIAEFKHDKLGSSFEIQHESNSSNG